MNKDTLYNELLSMLQTVQDDPVSAQVMADKAIIWASRNGWIHVLALANLVTGWANAHQHINDTAIDHLQRAVTLFNDLSDPKMVAEAYLGMGTVYLGMEEYSQAIEHLRKTIAWLNRLEAQNSKIMQARTQLIQALMNLGYWSDAEHELMESANLDGVEDSALVEYQLLLLRLTFYRGDQRSIKDQMQICRSIILSVGDARQVLVLNYYSLRYVARYENFKSGESELTALWEKADKSNMNIYYLGYETALDYLKSDYPQKGVHWMSVLLDEDALPLPLQRQIHISLAHFYVAHLSYELATEHFYAAETAASSIRENEVNQQWVRYRADEMQQSLRQQIDQHKKNNQILAESNALLQAVNRIALSVNSSLDQEHLLRRLRDQLAGWIDCEVIAIAKLRNDELQFTCILEGDRVLRNDIVPLTEKRAWSVRAVNERRILYENDFLYKDEMLMGDSPNLVRSVSFTPLKCENRVIGILSLQSRRKNVFDSRAITLLEYIAPVIGIAFANLLNLQRKLELSGELNKQTKELRDIRELMAHLADHDEQTGLPNRHSLPVHFEKWRHNAPYHCFLIKVTNLDEVNNIVGFGTDEDLIKATSLRLDNRVRPEDLLIRIGRDQFMLFVQLIESRDMIMEFGQQLIQVIQKPIRAKNQAVSADAAIGVVKYPDHGETLEEIMTISSVALMHAYEDNLGLFVIE